MFEPQICLELDAVHYSFPGASATPVQREILHGVSLQARSGEVTTMIGPNGAGKTTTLNCAQGFLSPSAGSVKLLGENPHKASVQLRTKVGIMLQDSGLPQSVKPATLLRHIARLHRNPWPHDDLVERLQLQSFLGTSIRRLSGGQRQRVAIAAALIGNPLVVFFDEPSAGLDPQSRHLVHELIQELRSRGVGIILTTHMLEEAQKLADHVVILHRGEVVREGSIADLTADDTRTVMADGTPATVRQGPSGSGAAPPARRPAASQVAPNDASVVDFTADPSLLGPLHHGSHSSHGAGDPKTGTRAENESGVTPRSLFFTSPRQLTHKELSECALTVIAADTTQRSVETGTHETASSPLHEPIAQSQRASATTSPYAAKHNQGSNPGEHQGWRYKVLDLKNPADLHELTGWWSTLDVMPAHIAYEAKTLEDVFWEISAR